MIKKPRQTRKKMPMKIIEKKLFHSNLLLLKHVLSKLGQTTSNYSQNIQTAFLEHSLGVLPSGRLPVTLSGSPFFTKFGLTFRRENT